MPFKKFDHCIAWIVRQPHTFHAWNESFTAHAYLTKPRNMATAQKRTAAVVLLALAVEEESNKIRKRRRFWCKSWLQKRDLIFFILFFVIFILWYGRNAWSRCLLIHNEHHLTVIPQRRFVYIFSRLSWYSLFHFRKLSSEVGLQSVYSHFYLVCCDVQKFLTAHLK